MLVPGFTHNFELQRRGGYEGPNIAAAEHFSGVEIEQALARELIQNALDAKAPASKRVEVDFDLQQMLVSDIPDVAGLRDAAERASHEAKTLEGGKALSEAFSAFSVAEVAVLCVGDSGTTGLTGTESVDDPHSALSSLTRSDGASSSDGDRGGSFGIGASVGVLASRMRTVVYVSKASDNPDPVLASTARFASFKDGESQWRQSTGHLTAEGEDDLRYPRGIAKLGQFTPRTQNGTDVYVLDYRGAANDSALLSVKRSAAENFWAAIHEGALVVRGSSQSGDWVLSTDTLEAELRGDERLASSTLPFYSARTEGTLVAGKLAQVGNVELYVKLDNLPDNMHFVQFMRKPLMKVQNYEQRGVAVAAVFVCRDDKGNELLRRIEPPAHDRWNDRGPRSNAAAVHEIRAFVRTEIRKLIPEQLGETAEIRGLARFLPTPTRGPQIGGERGVDQEGAGPEGSEEGATELGVVSRSTVRAWQAGAFVALPTPAVAGSDGPPGRRGERDGRKPKGKGKARPNRPSPVNPGDGRSRLDSRDVALRAFVPRGSAETVIVLSAAEAINGDLELTAIGSDDDFELALTSAVREETDADVPLQFEGATIRDLAVDSEPIRLRVTFGGGRRYRLGVRDG